MNTIIFFYQKKGLQEPKIDAGIENPSKADEYLLVRVGLDLEEEAWFGQSVGQTVQKEEQQLLDGQESEPPGGRGLFGAIRLAGYKRQEKKRQETARRRLEQLLAAREEQRRATEGRMQLAAERILNRVDGGKEGCYVCEDNLKNYHSWKVWLQHFPMKEFDGYLSPFWAGQLLRYGKHPQFVILGVCQDIFGLIESCVHRMKGLRWILRERDCTQELMDFVENFYVEYGLAIVLRTLKDRAAYRKLQLSGPEPVNILDFSGEDYIPVRDIARGSVWLDMFSSAEKQRWIAGRGTGIQYYSLKEEWKERGNGHIG